MLCKPIVAIATEVVLSGSRLFLVLKHQYSDPKMLFQICDEGAIFCVNMGLQFIYSGENGFIQNLLKVKTSSATK